MREAEGGAAVALPVERACMESRRRGSRRVVGPGTMCAWLFDEGEWGAGPEGFEGLLPIAKEQSE